VVNEEAAAELFGEGTTGRRLKDGTGEAVEVIGVVARKRVGPARPAVYYDDTNRLGVRAVKTEWYSAAERSELERAELDTNVVSANYFRAMGFTVTTGRAFTDAEGGCRVAVVNQEASDLYFGGQAVGAAIIDDFGERTEIIGVAHAAAPGAFARRVEPAVYLPMAQDCLETMTMILGTRTAGGRPTEVLKTALESVPGRGIMVPKVKTFETYLRETALAPLHIATAIVGACAALALFLGVLGLYGALSDAARARRREVAIRVALGARRRHVIGQVLEEGGRLALVGMAFGLVGSMAVAVVLPRMMWGVGHPEWWVWAAGPVALACAVVAASVGPVRRSVIVDPMQVLRDR
jgi:putative ABC transport system permease protein